MLGERSGRTGARADEGGGRAGAPEEEDIVESLLRVMVKRARMFTDGSFDDKTSRSFGRCAWQGKERN